MPLTVNRVTLTPSNALSLSTCDVTACTPFNFKLLRVALPLVPPDPVFSSFPRVDNVDIVALPLEDPVVTTLLGAVEEERLLANGGVGEGCLPQGYIITGCASRAHCVIFSLHLLVIPSPVC